MQDLRVPSPTATELKSLFPMPMTSIEKYHWLEDTAEHPNFIFAQLRFADPLDADLARLAWQTATERQPATYAVAHRRQRWQWEFSEPQAQAAWPPPGCLYRYQDNPASAAWKPPIEGQGVGLVISNWTRPREDEEGHAFRGQASFFAHHALADGVGSLQVINDWRTIYDNLLRKREPLTGIHPLDLERLPQRNNLGLLRWRYLKHLPKQPIALFGAAKFVLRKTPPLVPGYHGRESGPPPGFPAIMGTWLSAEASAAVYRQAQQLGITSNALLMGQLFLALADWRRRQSPTATDRDWMRMILPINIRTIADRRMPATNRTSLVQIDRRTPPRTNEDSFFRMLDREVKIIRGWQLEKMFLLAVRGLSLSDAVLRRAANSPTSRGMAVFTDLGRPFRRLRGQSAGASRNGLQPVAFDLVGPIRPGTPANFSVTRFDGRLRISLHYDRRVLKPAQAEELLATYRRQLSGEG